MAQTADHKLVRGILDVDQTLSEARVNESWHDLEQLKDQAQTMFELGLLDLDVKARVESLFWQVAERIQLIVNRMDPAWFQKPADADTKKTVV